MKTCFLFIALLFLCPQAFGEESLTDLIKILRDDSAERRMEAAHAIGCKGEEAKKAVSALKSRLRDDDVMVQIFAVNALARIGPSASSAVSSLRIALRHPHACVREAAAWALGSIGPEAKSASGKLKLMLRRDKSQVARLWADWALTRILAKHKPNILANVQGLKRGDRDMRENAVRILGLYGPHAKSARPALLAFAVKHRREGDTDKVLRAYMSIGPAEEDIQDLASFLGEDESHAEEASAALAQIGMPAIPSLVKGLKIKGSRRYCAKALGFIGPPASNAAPALVEILESGGYEDAAQALGKIGKASVVPLCKSMKSMGHTETHKRIWAARAYIHVCKRGDAIPPQLDQLMGDMYPNVKSWAAAAVLKSDPGQAKALSILRANLTHCDPNCRVEAACALLIAGDAAVPLLPEIIAALADTKSPSARILAMVVGMHADKAGKAIPTLAKGLANLDLTRSHAEALARFGPKAWRALPDLIRAMAKMGDWPNGKYIAKAIQNIRG